MLVVDANIRGAGKTLSIDAIALILTGGPMPRMVRASSIDEERKRILAIADAGDSLVLIDNVDAPLGGSALDAALTATVWRDRRLGASEIVTVPLLATWYATGNNITLKGDTSRRVMSIRLRSPYERPEERTDLVRTDLAAWILANRAALLRDALIVLCAYLRAGAPSQALRPWGSYESWSRVVRGAVVWAGLPDPGDSRLHAQTIDSDGAQLEALLDGFAAIEGGRAISVRRACELLEADASLLPELRAALLELAPTGDGALDPRRIGNALKQYHEQVRGGRMLCRLPRSSDGVRWVVRSVGAANHDTGDAGDADRGGDGVDGQSEQLASGPRSSVTGVTESPAPDADPEAT
jgi:hypothetical protein